MPKLTMQALSEELTALHARLRELEEGLDGRVEEAMAPAMKLLRRLGEAKTSIRIGKNKVAVPAELRYRMIEELAFLHSLQHGGRTPEQDWFEAEAEVNRMLEILAAEKPE